ncbi:MAG: gamma-glutamyl-gamma-aminobutyrate hydrolase family protein [Alphaproteobacteria bacterium]|nr:gamma-glutamyl-gamma-aminobutyrate hydrolase family protein [Alphaproteobacteria bacterium]
MSSAPHPLVGVPACVKTIETHPFHAAGHKYITAIAFGADAQPVIIPALGAHYDIPLMIERFDGFLVTGSPSNVEPHRYAGPPSREGTLHDRDRDETTLPLIRAAIDAGVPLLAICRGIQELNVALGGTLHQNLHEVPDRLDHRAPEGQPHDIMYGPAHAIEMAPGGMTAELAGTTEMDVNSLHSQGIDRPGEGLVIEATAPDGTVEAVRVDQARAFALGIQWHPEFKFQDNAFGRALFGAFGDACRAHATASHDKHPVHRVA